MGNLQELPRGCSRRNRLEASLAVHARQQ